jgi:glycerol 3-phosphatase-2
MAAVVAGGPKRGNIVCDLDGVVYRGRRGIEGAGEALSRLESSGLSIVFVTNNSTRTPGETAATVAKTTGYPARADQVIGSADAGASLLEPLRPTTMVVGGDGIIAALRARAIPITDDPRDARAVIVGLDIGFTYARLDAAAAAVRGGARFIATNTDITFPGSGGIHLGAGAIVAAIAAASGRAPEVAGKPHAPIRALIRRALVPGPVWVVGDRPETDLAMAKAERWRGVLVLTGITADPVEVPADLAPDIVVDSIAVLPDLISALPWPGRDA